MISKKNRRYAFSHNFHILVAAYFPFLSFAFLLIDAHFFFIATEELQTCKSCSRTGHSRRTYRHCTNRIPTSTTISATIIPETPQPTCKSCGRIGHLRRTHYDCANRIPVTSDLILQLKDFKILLLCVTSAVNKASRDALIATIECIQVY
jgi:hypothetical protein